MNILAELQQRRADAEEFSSDYLKYKSRRSIPLFVYDEMQYGGNDGDFLEEADFVGKGTTVTSEYIMKTHCAVCDGARPFVAAYRPANGLQTACLRGEIYMVSPTTLLQLDTVMMNEQSFRRISKHVWADDQDIAVAVNCQIYIVPDEDAFKHLTTKLSDKYMSKDAKIKTYYQHSVWW